MEDNLELIVCILLPFARMKLNPNYIQVVKSNFHTGQAADHEQQPATNKHKINTMYET